MEPDVDSSILSVTRVVRWLMAFVCRIARPEAEGEGEDHSRVVGRGEAASAAGIVCLARGVSAVPASGRGNTALSTVLVTKITVFDP